MYSCLYLETPVLSLLGPALTSVNSSSRDLPDTGDLFRLIISITNLQIPSPYSSSLETIPLTTGHQECAHNFINGKACFAVENLHLFKLNHFCSSELPLLLSVLCNVRLGVIYKSPVLLCVLGISPQWDSKLLQGSTHDLVLFMPRKAKQGSCREPLTTFPVTTLASHRHCQLRVLHSGCWC